MLLNADVRPEVERASGVESANLIRGSQSAAKKLGIFLDYCVDLVPLFQEL